MNVQKSHRPAMRAVTRGGTVLLPDLTDAEATLVARHDNAVRKYLYTGDHTDLEEFDGMTVAGHQLETDLDELDRYALRGEIRFEDIYDQEI